MVLPVALPIYAAAITPVMSETRRIVAWGLEALVNALGACSKPVNAHVVYDGSTKWMFYVEKTS